MTALWRALRTPLWVSRIVWFVGAVTVASALLPALRDRTALITRVVPAFFPAAATTGAAAAGLVLVVVSQALRRGKARAWLLATVLSAVTAVLHLVKGLDVEEALLACALVVLLIASRDQFTARPDPRSLRRLAAVVVVGPVLACWLGWVWLAVDSDGQVAGTTQTARFEEAALGLLGIPGPVSFVGSPEAGRAAIALVVLGASVLLLAVLVALQPAAGPHPLSEEETAWLRQSLERWGSVDSLSYFALRDDRSVILSPTGKAALTYRVVGTVSLAAGDPVGDPEAWPGADQRVAGGGTGLRVGAGGAGRQ